MGGLLGDGAVCAKYTRGGACKSCPQTGHIVAVSGSAAPHASQNEDEAMLLQDAFLEIHVFLAFRVPLKL